jgi:hypothetical protein
MLGRFLGVQPQIGGLPYNSLILRGSLQMVHGASVLTLSCDGGRFLFRNNPYEYIDITSLTMTKREDGNYVFNIDGEIAFSFPDKRIDIFSYDSLAFSGYRVYMKEAVFIEDVTGIAFDMDSLRTKARNDSLCKTYGAVPVKVVNGCGKPSKYKALSASGWVNTSFKDSWFGLECGLKLGSLGNLAGGNALGAKLLLSWDESGAYFCGIALPDSALIQNIFGMTFGSARLLQSEDEKITMYIDGIAVEFFGKIKLPTSGNISMALSGGDDGTGWFGAFVKDGEDNGINTSK